MRKTAVFRITQQGILFVLFSLSSMESSIVLALRPVNSCLKALTQWIVINNIHLYTIVYVKGMIAESSGVSTFQTIKIDLA